MNFKRGLMFLTFSIFLIQIVSSVNILVDSSNGSCSDVLGNPFCSIQSAINNASSGDKVEVLPGNYTSFQIDKELEVFSSSDPFGDFPARVVPLDSSSNYIIQIISSDVTIKGFLVDGSFSVGAGNHLAGIRVNTDSSNTHLTDILIENNYVRNIFMGPLGSGKSSLGIQLYTDSRKNPSYELRRIKVVNNTINNISSSLGGAYGIQTVDDIFGTSIENNHIKEIYGLWSIGIAIDSHNFNTSKTDVEIIKNDISFISPSFNGTAFFVEASSKPSQVFFGNNFMSNSGNGVLNNNFIEILDARENYWGSCDGPSNSVYYPFPSANGTGLSVIGEIEYSPFIGVCFNEIEENFCLFEEDNLSLEIELEGKGIFDVWISYKNSLGEFNKTYERKVGENYSFTINSEEIKGGENITWRFYSNDSYRVNYSSEEYIFYVRNKTDLIINPSSPDGINEWYISEPEFYLSGDSNFQEIFYYWSSGGLLNYLSPFGLEKIPNQPNITAGKLELNYWSSFSCGNESKNSKSIKVDLTNPSVDIYYPLNQETVFGLRPEIYAYLEEEYQSNSGINLSSIKMFLNEEEVNPNVSVAGLIDAEVSFFPEQDLEIGENNVSLFFEDNSGRNGSFSWSFIVNEEIINELNLSINAPMQEKYAERRVEINLSVNMEVSKIEYIDYNSRNPNWKTFCRSCEEYGLYKTKLRSFGEGESTIGFRVVDEEGNVLAEENKTFFIDSKEPRIYREEPRTKFSNGNFSVEIIEENLDKVYLNYGNEDFGFRNEEVNTSNCYFNEDKRHECQIGANLSDFEGEEILFWFNSTDIVGNTDIGRTRKIRVDTISPVVNSFSNESEGRRIKFFFNISEENFDKVSYIDYSESRPGLKTLCSRLDKDGICEKSKYFKSGEHNISINIYDKAGNFKEILTNEKYLIE